MMKHLSCAICDELGVPTQIDVVIDDGDRLTILCPLHFWEYGPLVLLRHPEIAIECQRDEPPPKPVVVH